MSDVPGAFDGQGIDRLRRVVRTVEALPPRRDHQDDGRKGGGFPRNWIQITSIPNNPIIVTLQSGSQIVCYPALWWYFDGTIPGFTNNNNPVWFFSPSGTVPSLAAFYDCRCLGADINGVTIWACTAALFDAATVDQGTGDPLPATFPLNGTIKFDMASGLTFSVDTLFCQGASVTHQGNITQYAQALGGYKTFWNAAEFYGSNGTSGQSAGGQKGPGFTALVAHAGIELTDGSGIFFFNGGVAAGIGLLFGLPNWNNGSGSTSALLFPGNAQGPPPNVARPCFVYTATSTVPAYALQMEGAGGPLYVGQDQSVNITDLYGNIVVTLNFMGGILIEAIPGSGNGGGFNFDFGSDW